MTACDKFTTMALRILQLVGAVIVIGLSSKYISTQHQSTEYHVRFIVTDVVAVISVFFGFIWLLPFSSNHMNYWVDGVIAIAFAADSAWLVYRTQKMCGKASIAKLEDAIKDTSLCDKWMALYVMSLICTALWIITALMGCFWVKKHTVKPKAQRQRRRR